MGLASLLLAALLGPPDAARSGDQPPAVEAPVTEGAECPAPGAVPAEPVPPGCPGPAEEGLTESSEPAAPEDVQTDPQAAATSGEPTAPTVQEQERQVAPDVVPANGGVHEGGTSKFHAGGREGGTSTFDGGGAGAGPDRANGSGDGENGSDRGGGDSKAGGLSALEAPIGSAFVGSPVVVTEAAPIPSFLIPIYQECGREYGIPWRILAAINQVETAFGSNLGPSSAGAVGWMQFMPSTWRMYGVDADRNGRADPYDPDDAICAAANYLRASGAPGDMRAALFAYNHADWYVEMVLSVASSFSSVRITDPIPPAARLAPEFGRALARISRHAQADWAVVLAVLRAQGKRGHTPASTGEVREIAARVGRAGGQWQNGLATRARSLVGRGEELITSEVTTLARYNRAVGLRGLVRGMNDVRDRLAQRVLDDPAFEIYEGGREDIEAGRIDPRVLTLLLYLADGHKELEITSLITGHGFYARPGVPSAHIFGEAVDIAAIDGVPLLGNQDPGSTAELAVREILNLPSELQPSQVISLFEMGGPSFYAADHHDHIHVGF